MIQTGWLVSDSLLILYVKTKIATKWWLTNTSLQIAIWQYIAICYKAIHNMMLTRIARKELRKFSILRMLVYVLTLFL